LDNLNDYLRRNPEVRRTAWMMVSKGKALDLMQTAPKLERVPTIYLHSTLDEAVRMGKFPTGFIGVFWSNSVKKGQEGFLPYVDVKKEDNVELQGLAYFKGSRMVGRSSPLQIAAYLAIKGENPAGYRTFINVGEDSAETLMVYAARRKSDLDVDIRDGQPHF
jgi:spore germination protein KC